MHKHFAALFCAAAAFTLGGCANHTSSPTQQQSPSAIAAPTTPPSVFPIPNPPAAIIEDAAARDARMAWFREARFGMFIHWGLYAVPAGQYGDKTNYGEWIQESAKIPASQYVQFVPQFNPVKFDARAWAKMAKEAGVGYIVITSKHHDGFAMFDTRMTPPGSPVWGIMATPYARDPLKDLAEACREQGIRFCLYHSIMDWHSPYYAPRRAYNDTAAAVSPQPDMDKYVAYLKGQLKEVLTNYGPIGILWFDGEWESTWDNVRGRDLYNYVRSLQPDIIVNNRVAKSRSGMAGMSKGEVIGDYGTPEQNIPGTGFPGVDWESCMTMNDHWGYNARDDHWKSSTTLIRNLVDCASKGGNYLLNVGPTAEGLIPQPSVDRMQAIGQWMKVNATSVRGTTAGPFNRLKWGRATTRGNTLYLHVFNWPADHKLLVPMKGAITSAALLAQPGTTLSTSATPDGLVISLPDITPDPASTVIQLNLAGPVDPIVTLPKQQPDGKIVLTADDATLEDGRATIETLGNGPSSIGHWRDLEAQPKWTVQVTTPGTFTVELLASCLPDSAGTPFEVRVGQSRLQGTVAPTTGWNDFKPMPLTGSVTIDQPGPVEIRISPKAKPKVGVMNLRTVTLTPTPR